MSPLIRLGVRFRLTRESRRMFRLNVSRELLKRIVKVVCVVQLGNALVDYFLWVTAGYHVPSWALATLVVGYSVLLLSYDKLTSEP